MRRKLTSILMAIAMAIPVTGFSVAPARAQNWNCSNGDWLGCQSGNNGYNQNNNGYNYNNNGYNNRGYSGAFNSRNRYNQGNNGNYGNGGNSGGWNCANGDYLGCNNGNNGGNYGNRWGNNNWNQNRNWGWNRDRDWNNDNRYVRPRHGWRERHRDERYWRHQRRSDNGKAIVGGIIAGAAATIITGAILDAERRNNLPPVGTYIPEKDSVFEGTAN